MKAAKSYACKIDGDMRKTLIRTPEFSAQSSFFNYLKAGVYPFLHTDKALKN